MIYSPKEEGGGGEDPKKKVDPPKGYKPTSAKNRRDWNDMLDGMQKDGLAGSKNLDQMDKKAGESYIENYRKENPGTSVTSDMIPHVQYEHQQLRSGESFAGMSPEHTRILRKQLDPNYLKRETAEPGSSFNSGMSRQYYPEFKKGDKSYGTDAESYMKDFTSPPVSDSTTKEKPIEREGDKKEGTGKDKEDGRIPLPNYNDTTSRGNYLKQWAKKYGDLEGKGDTVLKINEIPRGGSDTMKNISIKAAKDYGIDPSLLYASAMHEGASALFKDKSGLDTRHKKPGEFGYQAFYGDKDFPINGNESMGVPDFANRFPELVSGGYLPKDFASKFRGKKNAGEYSENDFKTVEDGMKAKAALMKFGKDYVDKYAKKEGIELSKTAEDFFSLVFFNGGEGGVHKLLKKYNDEGLLKDDKFLKEHPHKGEKIDPKDDIWTHVAPRLKMAQALKKEKHFDDGNTH